MRNRLVKNQLNNVYTYSMYLRQMSTLAKTVFIISGLPDYIDVSYMNSILLNRGSIAFFYDDVLNSVLCLEYCNLGKLDIYGRPTSIQVFGKNGYTRVLKQGEFIIMYDNLGRYPLYLDIMQYALRVAEATRTIDININQQKTPRIWKTPANKELSTRKILNNVDGNVETILTYEGLDVEGIQCILEPAPFISDKVSEEKEKIWNEFLRLIGVANTNFQKKERNIKDEVFLSQGGTIASRVNRFEPRKKAIEELNEKFELDLKLEFYDGLPTTFENSDEFMKGDDEDDGEYVL